jgi:repressor of nif and glnA expression
METSKGLPNTVEDKLIAELRHLEALGLIKQVEPGKYQITELGKQTLTKGKQQ